MEYDYYGQNFMFSYRKWEEAHGSLEYTFSIATLLLAVLLHFLGSFAVQVSLPNSWHFQVPKDSRLKT